MLPIIRKLMADGHFDIFLLSSERDVQRRLRADALPFHTFEEYIRYKPAYIQRLAQFTARWRELQERLSSASVDSNALRPFLAPGLRTALLRRMLLLMQFIDAFEAILDRERIRAIVSPSDTHAIGKAAALLGNRRGIPTVVLQHGQIGRPPNAVVIGFLPLSSHKMLCGVRPGSRCC